MGEFAIKVSPFGGEQRRGAEAPSNMGLRRRGCKPLLVRGANTES